MFTNKAVLTVPCPRKSRGNRGSSSYIESFEKKKWMKTAYPWLLEQKQRAAHLFPLQGMVRWTANVEVYLMMDADNLVALLKWPIDLLVEARVIKNDDHKTFWPLAWPTQEYKHQVDRIVTFELYWGEVSESK